MEEIWKPVIGYEGLYEVSNFGNIISHKFNNYTKSKLLKPKIDKDGYLSVVLYSKKNRHYLRVHRIVLQTFNPIINMENLSVNHKNGIKNDNRLDNLEWCSSSENRIHYLDVLNGRKILNMSGLNKPLAIEQCDLEGNCIRIFNSLRDVKQMAGFDRKYVSYCCRGLRESYKGYRWRFV